MALTYILDRFTPRTSLNSIWKKAFYGLLIMTMFSFIQACAPILNDITTDTLNPPAFKAILPLRQDAPVPATYPGAKAANLQAKHYPDIQPLFAAEATTTVFQMALSVAQDSGWEIIEAAPEEGRIEAVDTTAILRFKDDIVVRITADGAGSRVDVRSTSRVGKSDLGKNAKRIRGYFERLRALVTVVRK